jgi:hypothetical protein
MRIKPEEDIEIAAVSAIINKAIALYKKGTIVIKK